MPPKWFLLLTGVGLHFFGKLFFKIEELSDMPNLACFAFIIITSDASADALHIKAWFRKNNRVNKIFRFLATYSNLLLKYTINL